MKDKFNKHSLESSEEKTLNDANNNKRFYNLIIYPYLDLFILTFLFKIKWLSPDAAVYSDLPVLFNALMFLCFSV